MAAPKKIASIIRAREHGVVGRVVCVSLPDDAKQWYYLSVYFPKKQLC